MVCPHDFKQIIHAVQKVKLNLYNTFFTDFTTTVYKIAI